MGAYAYCENCDQGLPGPYSFSIDKVVKGAYDLDNFRNEFICGGCGVSYYNHTAYHETDFIEELADRLIEIELRIKEEDE